MADKDEPAQTPPKERQESSKDAQGATTTDNPVEKEPAVERGERLATSKIIARSGKEKGFVPGASPQKP